MTKPIKILLTGFEPYGAYPENVSWAVAEGVTACAVSEAQVVAELLPVSFRRVGAALRAAVEHHRPDCLVMLGQSPASTNVKLERVALNLMDSAKGDNDGYRPDEEPICAVGPLARSTTLPLKTLCKPSANATEGLPSPTRAASMSATASTTRHCNSLPKCRWRCCLSTCRSFKGSGASPLGRVNSPLRNLPRHFARFWRRFETKKYYLCKAKRTN